MFRARSTFLLEILFIILNISTQIEGFASCHPNPCKNNATCITPRNQDARCSCSEEFSGEFCQFKNPCHSDSERCLNGAVCKVVPSSTGIDVICNCPIGFHGTMCEIQDKESACYDNPCKNGGSCLLNGSLRNFKCTCPAGYTGLKCQDRDHCSSRPCQNGADCMPSGANFTCHCRRGFTGHTCARDIDECLQQPGLCLNGGSCENLNGGYKCHCPPTFAGNRCEKPYVPCSPSPCLNGGACRVTGPTFHQCLCAPGFSGPNCEHNIDDCKENRCAPHSRCVDGIDDYACSCPAEWTGRYCTEDVDECLTNPCKNEGTCHNKFGSFFCTCVNGWTAKDCSVNTDDCAEKPCYNGGTCHDRVGSYYCECPPGKTGLRCQLDDACVSNPCHGEAKCETSPINGVYVCTCSPGWTGTNCDKDKDECFGSSQSPCEHKGICINTPGSFTCKCAKGFSGERCELNINECDPDPCQNGGMCLDKIGRFECICTSGFSGTECQINVDDCASSPCMNGGSCLDRIGMYECQCRDGFVGINCQTKIDHCISGQCLNGATCTDVGASYFCTCLRGFTGRHCEKDIDECRDVDCGMGRCIDQVGSYKCQCHPGYMGQKCNVEVDECSGHPCLNGGSCKDLLNSFFCSCLPGTNGTRCEVNIDDCLSRPCQHGGHCTDHINHFTCSCLPGFAGSTCEREIDECASNPCMNNGRCFDLINGFKCECPRGYNDYLCASNVDECLSSPCLNGATCLDGINRYECQCKKGFEGQRCEKEINECNSNPCQHGGSCEDQLGFYNCTCLPGFKGTNCEINIDECSSNPCSHGGKCVDKSGGFECFCRLPYAGPLCLTKLDPCSNSECRYGARCIPDEHFKNYTCQCVVGFTGRFCSDDIDECKLNRPCRNGGQCLNTEGSYLCQCPLGYEGRNCETNPDDCHPESCLNGGQCIDGLKDYECQCKPGFGGRNCQHDLNECASSPCLNGATCLDFVNSYACKCQPGFSGLNCHVNDQDCTDSSCLFGGTCIDLVNSFKCNCTPGHLGANCQHKLDPCQENPEFCLNGGTCVPSVKSNSLTDLLSSASFLPAASCHCSEEFTGSRCDTLIDWCSQSPCWNGATCTTKANQFKCTCRPGFTGALCDVRMVSCAAAAAAKNIEKAALCQNGGTCIDAGSTHFCRCKPGYEGSYCQKKTDECASMPCRNGATCHDLPNRYNCSCPPGFQGINCELDIDECSVRPCQNSGTCHDLINGFRCTCPRGTEGLLCEINVNDCKNNSCLNGGSCKDKIGSFECLCPPGFSGPRCEGDVNECLSNRCHEEGSFDCLQLHGDYRCVCRPEWKGRLCDEKMMLCSLAGSLSACENGATCIETANKTQFCMCRKGFSGNRCQYNHLPCEDRPCKNGGSCIAESSGFKCLCAAGFAGAKCEMKMTNKCFSNPCRHGGTCLEKTFYYQCICPQFWSGENCEIYDEQFEGGSGIRKDFQILFNNQHLDCIRNNCSLKIGNGICDKNCDSFQCNFDGYECSYTSKPYHSCNPVQLQVMNCFEVFNNGICDKACANESCLFDGWDCLEQSKGSCDPLYDSYCSRHYADGHCDRGCNTAECGWDGLDCESSVSTSDSKEEDKMADGVLVMVVMTSPENFHNVAPQFFRELSFLLRSVPRIMHDSKGREMIYPWIPPSSTTISSRRKRSTAGSKLYMKLDNAKCVDNCFTTTETASEFIAQSLRNGWKTDVPIYSVSSEQDVSTKKTPVMMMIVMCACIIGLISFLALVLFNVTKKRSSGSTWLPEGFVRCVPSLGENKKLKSAGQSRTSDGFPSTIANSQQDFHSSEKLAKQKKLSNDPNASASSDGMSDAFHRKWSERHFKAAGIPRKISLSVPTPPFQDGDHLESPSICEDKLLLKRRSDEDLVDARGPDGYTPLMLASSFSTKRSFGSKPGENADDGVAMISDLISQGATVNATTDRTGETPLHLAARYGKTEAAKHLLEAGGDPNAQDCNGRTPLHAAVASDAKGVFLVLLRHRATKVNAPTEDGTTPLMLAVRLSVEDLAEELIKAEADVNGGDRNGKTALHWAASVNNYDAAKMLLEKGANKDAQDGQEETPLYAACKEGSLETAKVLLHYKASADIADHMDQLPRDVAAARMHDNIVQLIDDYVKNNLELEQSSTRLNRAGNQKSHDGGMMDKESNFSLPVPKGKKLKKLQMSTDESQSLLLRPDALRAQNYEKHKRKSATHGKFVGQNFFEMPPSYESACGRTAEEWKDIHMFNGMPVMKTLDSYSDQSFINFKVDTNQDNAINERLVSSMSPLHNVTPGTFSHYYLPSSSQVVHQPMNVSSYPLMSSKETTSFGHNSNSQFYNIGESYSMFPTKGGYSAEQPQLIDYSMTTGVTPNVFYQHMMNCSPDSTKNSSSDNKFSLKNSFKKLSAQTSQKPNRKNSKKRENANIPLSPAHMQILVNQQQQHLQQNIKSFSQGQSPNHGCSEYQQTTAPHRMNMLLMSQRPGMLATCPSPSSVPLQFDPYPTPSPDSPGIWSNSSPISGKSDHWSDNPVSSPNIQNFTALPSCVLTRINSNDFDSGSNVY